MGTVTDPEALGREVLERLAYYNRVRAAEAEQLRQAIAAVLDRYERDQPLSAATVLLRLDPEAYWSRGWPTVRTIQRHLSKIRATRLRPVAERADTFNEALRRSITA